MTSARSTQLQILIDQLNLGDLAAREALIELACQRVRVLTRQMLAGDRVSRFEGTDDVLQEALLELHKSLSNAQPPLVRDFMLLAAFHIRRAMVRFSRHYFGPHGEGTHITTEQGRGRPSDAWDHHLETPSRFFMHAEMCRLLHENVIRLPKDEREVTELIWFHGLSRVDAAAVLSVSERTVRRRWLSARLRLHDILCMQHDICDGNLYTTRANCRSDSMQAALPH